MARVKRGDGTFARKGKILNSRVVHSRVPDAVYSLLAQSAESEGVSVSEYVRYLIEDVLLAGADAVDDSAFDADDDRISA